MKVLQGRWAVVRGEEPLETDPLGACVALVLLDQERGVAGLLHYMLPEKGDLETPSGAPGFFASEGIPALIKEFQAQGGDPFRARVVVVGAGRFKKAPKALDLGSRNAAAARFYLKRLGLEPQIERVGGIEPRRVRVSLKEGLVVYTFDQPEVL
ncbi:chemotaxis protein CheD [Thermosulfurimonas marina]|uniref:Chemotaxis protein CheD n=1 Tax=Thermosulfurimonas marina TaxID=2047767 RepID=A0A6H1WRK4_9BACT|nr:chemotaxis protein CheD [Thermosulfurimonas marina]QJA05790.1 chemotaxis protein CheD [Thermosulfurimonas marina]